MTAIAEYREWGVKSIKQRRNDEHGNIEFLVKQDGYWMDTWEPQEVIGNAQVAIKTYLRSGSGGNPACKQRCASQNEEQAPVPENTIKIGQISQSFKEVDAVYMKSR